MSGGAKTVPQPYPVYVPAAQSQPDIQTEADKAAEEVKKKARKAGQGRASTILTSPLGVVQGAPTVQKTLLGQ